MASSSVVILLIVAAICLVSSIKAQCTGEPDDIKCPDYVRNGFCNNRFFSLADKQRFRGNACRLCPSRPGRSPANRNARQACEDKNPERCPKWAANGFCTNEFYTDENKQLFCAKTCGLCQ